jgi:uncharacterized membrane protein YphA (DoxX/SURF4 family)
MMAMWIGFSALLLLGIATRFSAVMAWLISISFGNLNSYLDNAGDTIRLILLFYVMVSPCGVVWSVDALLRRRAGPVYVYPWPIRLLFVQMIFIYFMNGMYKLFGPSWRDGYSLYYVLGYVELARYSQMSVPLSDENYVRMTRLMTWSVVVWEVLFPLLVIWKWPRRLALFMGVMFHLGIFATMELACFVPYALCMYVPLLPWEKLSRVRDPST